MNDRKCNITPCAECDEGLLKTGDHCWRCNGYGSWCRVHDAPPCGSCESEGDMTCRGACPTAKATGEVHL